LAPRIAEFAEVSVHVSGCAKGCAHPGPATLTVVGTADGCALVAGGSARDAPFAVVSEREVTAAIERFAREPSHENSHV
jgi:precorrin-3B synthase